VLFCIYSVTTDCLYFIVHRFQISSDQGHFELVKQYGDGLAETVRGLVHTARYDYFNYMYCYLRAVYVLFTSVPEFA